MKHGAPFQGSYPGTAESYLLGHLHLREKLFLAAVLLWAYCVPGCAHGPPAQVASAPEVHDAAGCVSVCKGATAVELEPTRDYGDMCKCWAPNAFAYTFSYPDTPEKQAYSRERWDKGMRDVAACIKAGLPWGPDATRDNIMCLGPADNEHGRNYEVPPAIPRQRDQSGRRT